LLERIDMPVKDRKGFRTSVILPQELQEQLVALSEANDVSVAWVIRQAVREYMEKHASTGKVVKLKPAGR